MLLKEILKKYTELNKSFIYESLKYDLDFSNQKKGNKRLFSEEDIQKFLYIRKHWIEKAVQKYTKKEFKTVSENKLETTQKQELNNLEAVLNQNKKLNEIVKIKEEQNQKYALLFKDEKREKENEREEKKEWIKKYDKLTEKHELLNSYHTKLKVKNTVFILLFLVSTVLLFLYIFKIININFS